MKTMSQLVAEFITMHISLQNTNKHRVSKKSGVNRTTVIALTNGTAKCGPRIDSIKPILNALGTDLHALELYIDSHTTKVRTA